jgi:hypothetical protein
MAVKLAVGSGGSLMTAGERGMGEEHRDGNGRHRERGGEPAWFGHDCETYPGEPGLHGVWY